MSPNVTVRDISLQYSTFEKCLSGAIVGGIFLGLSQRSVIRKAVSKYLTQGNTSREAKNKRSSQELEI